MLSVFAVLGYLCCGQAVEDEKIGLRLVEQMERLAAERGQAEAVGLVISRTETETSSRYLLKNVRMKTAVGEVRLKKLVVYAIHEADVMEGDIISVIGSISSFDAATNPGQFDYREYQSSMGIYLQMYGQKIVPEENAADPFLHVLGKIRRYVKGVYLAVSSKMGGTMAAMVLGDKSDLPDERYQLYLDSGIGHILTLSGLHLSLLGVGLHGLMRKKMTLPAWPAAMAVIGLLLVYLRLIGNGISATRAAVAIACSLLAGGLGKTYDSPSAAGLGLLLILRDYPMQIGRPSFWLSFGAVLALGLILPELTRWLKPRRKPAKALLSIMVVWLALMPVTALNQYVIQPYSILLNVLVVPMMGPVLIACICVLFAGSISAIVGAVAAIPVKLAFDVIDRLCELTKKLPGSQITVGKPAFGQLLVYAGVLAIFLAIVFRKNRLEWEQQETFAYDEIGLREKKKKKFVMRWGGLFLVSASLAVILMFGIGRNRLEMVFLDVGQGDCIFLRMPNGATMMVDGGSSSEQSVGEARIRPCLTWAGVRELDYLVMTHLDEDHINGLIELLEAGFPVRYLLVSSVTMDENEVEEIEWIARKNDTEVVKINSNDIIKCGKVEIKCISPANLTFPQTENECSVVLELTYQNFSCLLTGDVEGKGEAAVEQYVQARGEYTLLKVAHHGSKYSTSAEFLDAVRPVAAVISCGKNNSYGHPHEELIGRLRAVGSEIYCTAECGAVLVSTDGIRWEIEGFASPK